ncbi:maleylpyruvate isomerase family mycothiol-dependent enzyme [Amycolatopsis pithecellobii]|uniref:Maleylpyruvate isomerase family mycothiol-dependent enzyme n=1 Tax=Amycolatopsis pithecellobii TaxID=664692 RepID=A0A6N7ZAD8_9PSEU|nr:maleylpyruvate isomerase family mycothiol-dependent enzyme [Amycolatopsis pithecellobii]MTD58705.1 maleylpyruvate isomerase family mycothiol-dependent enzyme [Amycolatopsis pithecellobii]
MRHGEFLTIIQDQCAALRAAAVAAGPDTDVPTCPKWTVNRLVRHIGRVQSWVGKALAGAPDRQADQPPSDWAELLSWWDEQRVKMLDGLADPDAPAWLPFAGYPPFAGSWARRQAHEAAIHRLDAEHALTPTPSVVFPPEFAADGIDELITVLVPGRDDWSGSRFEGTVILRATDAGREWNVRLAPGVPPAPGAGAPDLTIEGSADAVYRRVWGRPSVAVVAGEVALLEPLASP